MPSPIVRPSPSPSQQRNQQYAALRVYFIVSLYIPYEASNIDYAYLVLPFEMVLYRCFHRRDRYIRAYQGSSGVSGTDYMRVCFQRYKLQRVLHNLLLYSLLSLEPNTINFNTVVILLIVTPTF